MRLFFPRWLCGGHLRGSVCATRSIKGITDCAEKSSGGRSLISKSDNGESHSNSRLADDEEEEVKEGNCNDDR